MGWKIMQAGYLSTETYDSRAAAQAAADALNEEADEECGEETCGDGAASVVEEEVV